jgi:hypothetical protein
VLRYKPYRSTYENIRLAVQFLRALHLSIFEQPPNIVKYPLDILIVRTENGEVWIEEKH